MSIVGDKEIRMHEDIVDIYRELQNLMGEVYGTQSISKEAILDYLGHISNKALNIREEYIGAHMGNDSDLLNRVNVERASLNQALRSTNGRAQSH